MPTGALQYGAEGSFCVWEHTHAGRVLYVFDDEYLAQRFAVSVGSVVRAYVDIFYETK